MVDTSTGAVVGEVGASVESLSQCSLHIAFIRVN